MAVATVDFGVLEELKAVCDTATVRELVAMFLSEAPVRLAEAGEALAAADDVRLQTAMHRLRSSAGNLGAQRLQALAEELELLEQPATQVDKVRGLLQTIGVEFRGVAEALDQFLKGLPAA